MYKLTDRARALEINSDKLIRLKGYLIDRNAHHRGIIDYTQRHVHNTSLSFSGKEYVKSSSIPSNFFYFNNTDKKQRSVLKTLEYGDIYKLPEIHNIGSLNTDTTNNLEFRRTLMYENLQRNYGSRYMEDGGENQLLKAKYGSNLMAAIVSTNKLGYVIELTEKMPEKLLGSVKDVSVSSQEWMIKAEKDSDIKYTPFRPYAMKHDDTPKYEKIMFYRVDEANLFKGDVIFEKRKEPDFIVKNITDKLQYTSYNEGEGTLLNKEVSYNDSVSLMPIDTEEINKPYKDGTSKLIQYTNRLFSQNKIGSLINRFHTSDPNETSAGDLNTAFDSSYGLSRGRNLLSTSSTGNGVYDNPYCRVWTAHHQYSKVKHLIRPFNESPWSIQKHLGELRPNNGASRLINNSVLDENGLVKFTPRQNDSSAKRCMFSIENLAWKDSVNVLSKEQIGPNNGRIMWFPPYNLKFSENVNVNWNGNNFIGRGEQIYTYTNTERSGTLDFTLLIDHPSILDKWMTNKMGGTGTSNQDLAILRFFAGCESFEDVPDVVNIKSDDKITVNVEQTINVDGGPNKQEDIVGVLLLFFPNNYSGVDERDPKGIIEGMGNYEMKGTSGATQNVDYDNNTNKQSENTRKNENKFELNGSSVNLNLGSIKGLENIDPSLIVNLEMLIEKDEDAKLWNIFKWSDDDKVYESLEDIKNTFDIKCEICGFASTHGIETLNNKLAKNRANSVKKILIDLLGCDKKDIKSVKNEVLKVEKKVDINDITAKYARCAYAIVKKKWKDSVVPNGEVSATTQSEATEEATTEASAKTPSENVSSYTRKENVIEYDTEHIYFKSLQKESPMVHKYISEKVKYFDPTFHSITPEGFNSRLTFLHQCTRQGSTTSVANASNSSSDYLKFAGNLSFGRAPYCILRIGDFFNTKICIDSMSIQYDNGGGVQWDLNPEGIGVQPMYATISLNFKFLGGQDISGPIERLQNAVTANYYANASIYNSHADTDSILYDANLGPINK